jgi:hypothetical protein
MLKLLLKQVIVATKNERTTTEADAKESSCQKEQVRIVSSRLYIYIYNLFLEILKYLN